MAAIVKPKHLISGALAVALLCFGLSERAIACWQAPHGPTHVKSNDLRITVTLDGKPIKNGKFQLKKTSSASAKQERLLKTGVTDSKGRLNFGAIAPGKYSLLMSRPSYEDIDIEVELAQQGHDSQILRVKFYADYCQLVEATDQR